MHNQSPKSSPQGNHQGHDVFLIGVEEDNNEYDFQSLNQNKLPKQQQQEVIHIDGHLQIGEITNDCLIQYGNEYPSEKLVPSQLQKQFQQIRFGQTQCNLMDLDLEHDPAQKSILQLTPYEYEQFIFKRTIQIQTPQLITEGYIMSYKLYQIKTRTENQEGENIASIQVGQKLKRYTSNHGDSKQTLSHQYDTCVSRRFSDFQYLNELLISKYGGFIIPLLPSKNFWTIVNLEGKQYAQTRTKSLLKYLARLLAHKTLKHSQELKHFLFQEDSKFSTQKGEYMEKNNRIEDKIISISSGALVYGKALYSRLLGASGDKAKNEEEIRLNKNKLTKEDLAFSEYEIVVGELMRIVNDMKLLVEHTIQQIQTIEDLNTLFSSPLTDSINMPTSQPTQQAVSNSSPTLPTCQAIATQQISEQFQQISQFIISCHAAIQRRKALRLQMEQLKLQQQSLQEKYKNSPRCLQLDLVRSKLSKLNKMHETYAEELIKQLQFHIDEGKGMLRLFVVKFQNLRNQFYSKH